MKYILGRVNLPDGLLIVFHRAIRIRRAAKGQHGQHATVRPVVVRLKFETQSESRIPISGLPTRPGAGRTGRCDTEAHTFGRRTPIG